ncbi:MAG: hypothetical protein IT318_07700 [Anaerolineales bacterium]|nr:hypothetical protein [Anaerolineales bacterium]
MWDAQKAALEVEDYRVAIAWAAQTTLRDIIGKITLADTRRVMRRKIIDQELQHIIDEHTRPWDVSVNSVEIRDIIVLQEMEGGMSRQARVILGRSR